MKTTSDTTPEGKTLITQLTANESPYLMDANVFTTTYSFYEIVFTNLIPDVNGAHLVAQYCIGGTTAEDSNGYTCVNISNDSGGNSFSTFTGSYLSLWDINRGGPGNGAGVNGNMTLYGFPGTGQATNGFAANVFSSSAYNNLPCITFCSGAYTGSLNTQPITGIKFFFDQAPSPGEGNITSGIINIYGWN